MTESFAPAIINLERQVALLTGLLPFIPQNFTQNGDTITLTGPTPHRKAYRVGEKTRLSLSGAENLKLFETDEDGNVAKVHHLTRAKGSGHG